MKNFFIVFLLFVFIMPLSVSAFDFEADSGLVDTGIGSGFFSSNFNANLQSPNLLGLIGQIISIVLSLLGVIFMILLFYGGYRWLMSQGKEEEIRKAKETIRAAVIGLIIIAAAYAITWFLGSKLLLPLEKA